MERGGNMIGFGEERREHMAYQDPMSVHYDLNRVCEESRPKEQPPEYWDEVWKQLIKSKMNNNEDLTTDYEYETAIKICKNTELKHRLKNRYIHFLLVKVAKLEKEIENLLKEKGEK